MEQGTTCDPAPASSRRLMLTLVGVGTFMSTLDISIVNVALPTLTDAFDTTVAISQWFVLSYTFTITVLLLAFGRLGDLIGRRRLYTLGIAVFTVGSVICGFSVSALMLTLARSLQGMGSAITMSAGPALVTEAFPARERGKALGFIGTAVALGLLAGPVIGGMILSFTSWRWMFFINIPVGIILASLMIFAIKGFDTRRRGGLDVPGAALMALSLACALVGLTFGDDFGWFSSATAACFLGSIFIGAAFFAVEKRAAVPILDIRLFSNRAFSIGAATGWANYAAIMPISVFMPFYLQNILHYKPEQVGLILASGPFTLAFVAPVAGTLSDRFGSRLLTTIGLAVAAVGILSLRELGPNAAWWDVVWRLIVTSLGSGLFVSPNSSSIMGSVRCEDLGIASGTVALVRNLGMVSGTALAGAIITSVSPGFSLPGLQSALMACAIIAVAGSALSSRRTGPGHNS